MQIVFLGTGTSQGVPVIGCDCPVCTSADLYDKRLRSSVMITNQNSRVVIDTGPDFRQQMLREKVKTLDAVVFTHQHKDHVAGLDDVRAFNYLQSKPMDIYATEPVQNALKCEFQYIFTGDDYPGIPRVVLHTIGNSTFSINGTTWNPIEVLHYKLPVLGFRIGDFTYITDANYVSDTEKRKFINTKVLVVNALRKQKHISHFNLEEAIALAREVNAGTTYLTHLSHLMGLHAIVERELPPNIHLAYDGLRIIL